MSGGLTTLEGRGQVELELGPEDLIGRIYQRPCPPVVGAANVVDPDVEPPQLGQREVGQLLGAVNHGVAEHGHPLAPFRNAVCGDIEILLSARIDNHVATGISQPPRDPSSYPLP